MLLNYVRHLVRFQGELQNFSLSLSITDSLAQTNNAKMLEKSEFKALNWNRSIHILLIVLELSSIIMFT